MAEKLGFYELLNPHFSLGLAAQNANGNTLRDLRDGLAGVLGANNQLTQSLPGAAATLSRLATGLLDYLSVETLHSTADETAVVYRGTARFGGEGRANPELPVSPAITSAGGQELSWQDDMLDFRLTVPRRSPNVSFDTTGLSGNDLTDLQQLNALLDSFADSPAGPESDGPGNDFRLELLIRTVRILLPRDQFLPARVGADGWLEPDPNFEQVVFEFPRLAFVLEQQGQAGNLNLTLRSWDAAGFDDPGDVDTARLFTLTPPLFLHSSRRVGFGIERLVADFSDDITPPEILEQFGIGDDFNGFWLPLVRLFIAPGRTTGLAFSARGKDLLFDFDKGFSGELALDILNRGGKLEVEPVFYRQNAKAPLEWARGEVTRNPDGTTQVSQGDVTIPGDGELHLSIRGSIPPYQVTVQFQEAPIVPDTTAGVNRPKWLLPEAITGLITIDVTDKGNRNSWHETIVIRHVDASGPVPPPRRRYRVAFTEGAGDDGFHIVNLTPEPEEQAATLRLTPDLPLPLLRVGTQQIPRRPDGTYRMVLTPGDVPAAMTATWTSPATGKLEQELFFKLEYPKEPNHAPETVADNLLVHERNDYLGLSPGSLGQNAATIRERLLQFLAQTTGEVRVDGFASFERDSLAAFDTDLSDRRAQALRLILDRLDTAGRSITANAGQGHAADKADPAVAFSDPSFRVARASADPVAQSKVRQATAELIDITPAPAPEPPVEHPPEAAEPERPPIFRRLGFRVRFERDQLVLGEVSGQLDFRLQAEEAAGFIQTNDTRNSGTTDVANAVQTPPAASQSGEQGVLDYRLTISYDTATRRLTEVLALGFDQQARDGWVHINPFSPAPLANTLGSLLVFAPLLNAGIDAAVNAQGEEATKNMIIAGVEVAIATTLGLTGALKFRKFTLFGIELSTTQLLPDNEAEEQARFGDLAALLDYAVDFEVDINLLVLTIRSKRDTNGKPIPIRVRYRGFGFRLNFQDGHHYQSVFDTSKGFDLGLAEPGALEVGGPLGPILRVDSVRVARQNPLVLELDLGLNANLGVISVESVRVRIPVEPPGAPTIIPTGIGVNVPGTLVGSGYLDIRDSGFTGALDVTLVPLKLRIQASVGLQHLEEGDRRLTAFFLGLGVEFPAPIPLANSGLGLYGLLGLFGMHYKRDEEPPLNPNLPVALDWFYNKAKGEPHLLAVEGRPTWVAAPDRWSFGVGLVLGTMEGAFVLNLKGMLVLELPGPRLLIFVKAQIFVPRPPAGKPADQTTGILAVVDLNIGAGYIAVGLIFTYEIKELLRIEVPIDTRFSFHDIEDWHLYIGSLRNKASAEILGIAKGTAYLMFDGTGIPDFPLGPLNGFSIAAGIAASLVLGDESSGLYAKVAGAVDMGVSTAPLHFFGQMRLEGRIQLWFIGLGASARLDVEAPEPLYVKGEVCGSVDLWLTEIEGCVGITIGDPQPLPEPESLATGLSLQSHSPALTEGQATDQPVDTSLGVSHHAGEVIPEMPLDVIPVLQMKYPPVFAAGATGLKPATTAPTLPPGSDGWFSLGGLPGQEGERQVRYEVQSLTISPALPDGDTVLPVTWWQPARPHAPADSQAADKGVNLALNSWIPLPFPRAYQRCEEQRRTIRDRFEVICRPVAPATAVLWTFNAHFTILVNDIIRNPNDPFPGYSPTGWKLHGLAWPDPQETHRSTAPQTLLHVHEPDYPFRTNDLVLGYVASLTGQVLDPAKVVPAAGGAETGQALAFPFLQLVPGLKHGSLPAELQEVAGKFLELAGNRERMVVESGDVAEVRALICANAERKVPEFMVLRAFNDKNELVEQLKLPGHYISTLAQLPAAWQDETGPWFRDVRRVFSLFTERFARTHQLFFIDWKPAASIARFELLYEAPDQAQRLFLNPPHVMLGVVEMLTRAEVERVVAGQHYQDEMVQVVVKSLEEGDKRPLFAPNTEYTVTVGYVGQIRKGNDPGVSKTKTFSQQFRFRTTATAPGRLNPWMLATLPENDAPGHFTQDKVQFIFNDAAVIQMMKAFGKSLRAVLRKANGNHPPEQPGIDLPVLLPVKALLLSPYAHTMRELAAQMPCMPHIVETEQHQVFTVDIPLERGTAYLLDIEATPAAADALTPLFRTAFTTSRFESARELAALVATSYIRERPLKNSLVLPVKTLSLVVPDDATPSRTAPVQVPTVTDAEMEAALLAAFGSEVPPAGQPGLTLLWTTGAPAQLAALLVDAPEPLVRTRPVPVEVVTPTPDDDAIQHFQTGRQLWLEITESGSGLVERIVYATGGSRAVLFLHSPAAGTLQLALRQYRHTLLASEARAQDFPLVTMPLPGQPPWEL